MSSSSTVQESSSDDRRFLHFTLKIMDRLSVKNFFCKVLGMKLLRHAEMDSGCSAQCNGDYESPWSKSVVAYGDENAFFAFELNYNYDVQGYKYGNDFQSITIRHRQAVENAKRMLDQMYIETTNDPKSIVVRSPDGHRFILIDEDVPAGDDPVQCLTLSVSDLKKSVDYYTRLLKMKVNTTESNDKSVKLYYGLRSSSHQGSKARTKCGFVVDGQCQLELVGINHPVDRGTGYGRKAIACARHDVELIQKMIEKEGFSILIPAMELGGLLDFNKDKIVILSDPDGHEICFVGEENYIKNCETDSDADKKFLKGLENKPDEPNKYLIGEDESNRSSSK